MLIIILWLCWRIIPMKINIRVLNKYKDPVSKAEYVGRGSPLGNPYPITKELPRKEAIAKFEEWITNKIIEGDHKVLKELIRLVDIHKQTGKLEIYCFCKPHPCHGDIIAGNVRYLLENEDMYNLVKRDLNEQ